MSSTITNMVIYHSLIDVVMLTENDTLDGGDVVPGCRIALAEIFGRA